MPGRGDAVYRLLPRGHPVLPQGDHGDQATNEEGVHDCAVGEDDTTCEFVWWPPGHHCPHAEHKYEHCEGCDKAPEQDRSRRHA